MLAFLAFALAAKKPEIGLTLKVTPQVAQSGGELQFDLLATNLTSSTVSIVSILEGSTYIGRAPSATLYVKSSREGWHPLRLGLGFCGNTNTIDAGDFNQVGAGKTIDLLRGYPWMDPLQNGELSIAGEYELKVVYDTTAPFSQWIGGPLPSEVIQQRVEELSGLYQKVPKGTFHSNVVKLRVTRATSPELDG